MERLTRILLALEDAEPVGLEAGELITVARYGSAKDPSRLLNRDINDLRNIGWDIRNSTERGTAGRYRLHARDTRLRVELAPEHQVQLVRAALVAGATTFPEKLGDDLVETEPSDDASLVHTHGPHPLDNEALDKAAYATENRCLIRFTYKQRPRVVHPHLVHPGASGWYLVGHEDGTTSTKRFVTSRMTDVTIDPPGTATVPEDPRYDELNPITWEVDSPTRVTIETTGEHRPHVETMLGPVIGQETDGDTIRLTVEVTHRAAFRARVYELGTRVRVIAPDDVRAEIVDELRKIIEVNATVIPIMRTGR